MADIVWDSRSLYVYSQTPKEQYEKIQERYVEFVKNLNDVNTNSSIVFQPLKKKQLEELELIREVSKVLQKKKDEDIKKSRAAAEEQTEQQTEQKTEEKESAESEEKKEESPADKAEA